VELQLTAYGGRDDGLFHAAAAESQSFGAQLTVEESQYQYDALIQRVGCAKDTDTLQCLRNTDIAVLTKNNSNIPTPGGAGSSPLFMWGPVIDGNFVTDHSYNLFSQGNFIKVPSIFGYAPLSSHHVPVLTPNRDDTNEGTIFIPSNINSVTDMDNFLKDQFANLTKSDLEQINSYFPESQQFSGRGLYWRATANAYGEIRYICPGIHISTMLNTHGQAASYNYQYVNLSHISHFTMLIFNSWDVLSPNNAANGLGVTHTAEFQSIWGTSNAPDNALIPIIQAYWTSFIRTKDPNTYKLKSAPEWTTFNSTGMGRLHFPNDPTSITMESVPADQRARCAFLQSIGPSIQQ
jgi:carboxylesterase type B